MGNQYQRRGKRSGFLPAPLAHRKRSGNLFPLWDGCAFARSNRYPEPCRTDENNPARIISERRRTEASVLRRLSKRRRSAQTVKTLPRTKWAGASPELLPVHPMQPGLPVCRRGKGREASNGFFRRGLKSNGKYGIIESSRRRLYAVPGDRNRSEFCGFSRKNGRQEDSDERRIWKRFHYADR